MARPTAVLLVCVGGPWLDALRTGLGQTSRDK